MWRYKWQNLRIIKQARLYKLVRQRISWSYIVYIVDRWLYISIHLFFITSTNDEYCVLIAVTLQRQGKRIDGPGLDFLDKLGVIEVRIGKIAGVFWIIIYLMIFFRLGTFFLIYSLLHVYFVIQGVKGTPLETQENIDQGVESI